MIDDIADLLAKRTARLTDTSVRDTLRLSQKPGVISFGGGIPNVRLFPVATMERIIKKLLKKAGDKVLQYNQTQGYPPLLEVLAEYYSEKWGLKIEPENVLVTTGSQQALDLLAKTLLNKGDRVLVEDPTYFVALSAFNAYQPRYETVKLEADGPKLEEVEKKLGRVKFFYTVPTFQNPTGVCWSVKKRRLVARLLKKHRVLLVEDDPYGELWFQRSWPPVFRWNRRQVVYLGSFSKTLAPGLRVGFVIARKDLIEKLVLVKQGMDIHTSTLSQAVVAEFLKEKEVYKKQLEKVRRFYRQQKETMVAALEKHAPEGVAWTKPRGGMFLWLRLPEKVDVRRLYPRAVKAGVAFIPGYVFYACQKDYRTLRLAYATVGAAQIKEGIKKLMQVVKDEMAR